MSAAGVSGERRAALVAIDATLTSAMTRPCNGPSVPPAEIKDHSELVLAGRFAPVPGVDECLQDPGEARA
ncbi:hypothetical protein [Accumulibacter sp.]|uniref:hypothetical protein n=1 Tax=Accumulibacter sp. TaxID=2053492 RepID=UPI0035B0D79C